MQRPDSRRLVQYALWAFAAALLIYAFATGGYLLTVLGFAAIYAIFVTGLNFFMGYAGQVSFGQNAFAALSGYTSAVLTATYGWQPIAALPLGVVGAVIVAFVVGYPALRLRGHYLAMATLALGMIVYEIAVEWQSITQGYMGISGIPPLGMGRWELNDPKYQLAFLMAVLVVALIAAWRLKESRFGMALAAIAGSEDAAKALGIDVARYKLAAFVIAAVYAAVAGSLMVHFVGFVSPEVFGLHMVISGFMMLYVGGIGSIAGPLFGALIVSLLPETFRAFKDYQDLAYGAALIIILIFAPKGAASLARFLPGSRK
ncbi:branched-chain amino acid ABC transporter permease [Polaromonas sp.]|uniref:branched-chain amino acid ABC transporter permease n=1 Tax=Polaromonas sp. TaxID=1869339 RepID=UPI0025E4706C|nr:branched-chain amino acid ABC transporter permease [Polaromonas sp.]